MIENIFIFFLVLFAIVVCAFALLLALDYINIGKCLIESSRINY